jgi:hypothetical protein
VEIPDAVATATATAIAYPAGSSPPVTHGVPVSIDGRVGRAGEGRADVLTPRHAPCRRSLVLARPRRNTLAPMVKRIPAARISPSSRSTFITWW